MSLSLSWERFKTIHVWKRSFAFPKEISVNSQIVCMYLDCFLFETVG